MRKIAVIFGGKSVEHDISIITALQTMRNLASDIKPIPIYIDNKGLWWTGDQLKDVSWFSGSKKGVKQVSVVFGEGCFALTKNLRKKIFVDCAVLCCHGCNCEDGTLAGVMEMANIPYTACGVLSSAIGMDKEVSKIMLEANNIYTPEFGAVYKDRPDYKKIIKELRFPVIVKPANLGSSVGISVCRNEKELKDALNLAFEFDKKALIERYLEGCREFNCACYSYKGKVVPSKVDEVDKGEIFSFDEKYVESRDKTKKNKLLPTLRKDIQELAVRVYKKMDCFGVVRVDFLYDEAEDCLYVNEINTIPGSLSFYLFPQKFTELLDVWINEGVERNIKKEKYVYLFNSKALDTFKEVENMNKYSK